jgi:hypothetical protein
MSGTLIVSADPATSKALRSPLTIRPSGGHEIGGIMPRLLAFVLPLGVDSFVR